MRSDQSLQPFLIKANLNFLCLLKFALHNKLFLFFINEIAT